MTLAEKAARDISNFCKRWSAETLEGITGIVQQAIDEQEFIWTQAVGGSIRKMAAGYMEKEQQLTSQQQAIDKLVKALETTKGYYNICPTGCPCKVCSALASAKELT